MAVEKIKILEAFLELPAPTKIKMAFSQILAMMISSKTGKKCIFGVFRPFLSLCQTASRPYSLSHINVLGINQSILLSQEPIHEFLKIYILYIEN